MLAGQALAYFWTTQNFWLPADHPDKVKENGLMLVALVLMLATALAGMRWSHRWRHRTGLLTVALVTFPVVYVLGHTSLWHDARVPLDGVLLIYSAFALASLVPGLSRPLRAGIGRAETLDRAGPVLPGEPVVKAEAIELAEPPDDTRGPIPLDDGP